MQSVNRHHSIRRSCVAVVTTVMTLVVSSCGKDEVVGPPDPPDAASNSRPMADAGPDLALAVRDTVPLDGSASSDPDGDALTYRWELLTQPAGSGATLSDPTATGPTFVADVDGDYVAELVVSDGALESAPDTVTITASPIASITTPSLEVGAALQLEGSAHLGIADHGGVTVRIATRDSSVALIAPDVDTPGTSFIDVEVATGQDTVPFVVQGVAGATGQVAVTTSVPGFADGTGTVTVAQPALSIVELNDAQIIGSNTVFSVMIGLPDSTGTAIREPQGVSAANVPPLVLTVTSSNGAAGRVTGAGGAGDTLDIELAAGVFEQQVTFEPLAAGATVVAGYVPGFVSLANGSIDVTVVQRGIAPFSHTIGAGLQYGDAARLSEADHGGVTFRIETSDTTVALIAPDARTPGAPFLDVVVSDGDDVAPYVVQGIEGATGTATVTATTPGFSEGVSTITVVQPAVAIEELAAGQAVGSADAFRVTVGVPNAAGSALVERQAISAAATSPLTLTVTSSDGGVGEVTGGGTTGSMVTVDLTAGMNQADLTFAPLAVGATTVAASGPGFMSTTSASVDVVVGGASITPFSYEIGAGLQWEYGAILDERDHGGVTVRIESSDPTLALIAPDGNTPGSAFIDVDVADGDEFAPYVVQGVAGATGTARVTASAPGFGAGVGTIDVVQPALTIVGLSGEAVIGSAQNFNVFIGVPDDTAEVAEFVQGLSAANDPPLELTVTSSDGDVGQIEAASAPSTITMQLAPGTRQPSFRFVTLTNGPTTVTASIPGFLNTTASVDVVVSNEGSVTPFSGTVGTGLQTAGALDGAQLSISNYQGVTVRIESSDTTLALITADPALPGSAFADVDVAAGRTLAQYWVQGVEGATGTVTITASAPGFSSGVGTMEVVQPAIAIVSLDDTTRLGAGDDFTAEIGVPRFDGVTRQTVSPAAADPVVITLTSSDGVVGQVTDGVNSGDAITVQLSPAELGFVPLTFEASDLGTTTVTASASGFLATADASADVTVVSPELLLFSSGDVGAGLEWFADVYLLGTTGDDPITVHLESSDPSLVLISSDALAPGSASLDLELASGVTRVRYYVQGVTGAAGTATITASSPGFTSSAYDVGVVEPGLQITGLSSTVVNPNDDVFEVRVGILCTTGAEVYVCRYQSVSPAQPAPLMMTVTSSDGDVGHVTDGVASGETITVELTTTSSGTVRFRPRSVGTTTVTASIPGFVTTPAGSVEVTVTNPQ